MRDLVAGELLQGRYRVLGVIGRGGFGQTYRGERDDGVRVAIKELDLERAADLKALELFEREAQVLARLDHPAIPRYVDAFTLDDNGRARFFLVQQLAPGRPLSAIVAEGWRPTQDEVVELAGRVLEALVYLQRQEPPVIHRDVKPQNLVRAEGGGVSLVDFGSVRAACDPATGGSTVAGSYGYMAPEQLVGHALPATDLYGLGWTLLHLLTHLEPWELPKRRLLPVFRDKVHVEPWLCDWLEGLVEPALEDRFGSAEEARAALLARRGPRGRRRAGPRAAWRGPVLAVSAVLLIAGGATAFFLSRPERVDRSSTARPVSPPRAPAQVPTPMPDAAPLTRDARDGHPPSPGAAKQHATIRALTSRGRISLERCSALGADPELRRALVARGRSLEDVPGELESVKVRRVLEVADEPGQISWQMITLLARLKQSGAVDLRTVMRDRGRPPTTRFQAALGDYLAGAPFDHRTLLELLRTERGLCLRTLLVLALQFAPEGEVLVERQLLASLQENNVEIRSAAMCALERHRLARAAPRLEQLEKESMVPEERNQARNLLLRLRPLRRAAPER
jgi:hypothetical protein